MQLTAALAFAPLLSMAVAQPRQNLHERFHHKRQGVDMVTVTDLVVVTDVITTTIWVAPGAEPSPPVQPSPPSPPAANTTPGLGALQQSSTTTTTTTPAAAPTPPAQPPAPPAQSPSPPAQSPSPPAAVQPSPPVQPAPPTQPSPPAQPAPSPSPAGSGTGTGTGTGGAPVGSTLPGATVAVPSCGEGSPCTGDATFYAVGMGSCGQTSSPSDMIVAVPSQVMGSLSSGTQMNPLCGKEVMVQLFESVGPVKATVMDKCGGCADAQSLDMSTGLFDAIGGNQNAGRYPNMTWWWA